MPDRITRILIRVGVLCVAVPVAVAFAVSSPSHAGFWIALIGVFLVVLPGFAAVSWAPEPNPLARGLAALRGLPDLTNGGAVREWLEERDEESAHLPDHSKRLILDNYFARGYEEPEADLRP